MEPDSSFSFTAELTAAQLTATARHTARKVFRAAWVLGLLSTLCAVLLLLSSPTDWFGVLYFIAFGAVAACLPGLAVRQSLRRARARLNGPITYRIDHEGVRSATQHTDGVVRWPLIDRLVELPGLLLVRVGKSQIIPVAIGQLPPQTRTALIAFAQSRLPAAAGTARTAGKPQLRPPTP